MADHIRLYSRPLVMDDVSAALSITGALPEYTPGDAFEGRLQVNNPIGRFKVEIMPDSQLPDGVTVRADIIASELVLKWASYRIVDPIESSPVLNGDFEDGDDGSWVNHHQGWSIVDGRGKGGSKAAEFGRAKGINNYVGVLVPVTDINSIIKLEASINHGSASTGELVAGPFILWYDGNRNLVRWTNPNQYVRGGKNGDWHDYSFAEGSAADPNIKFVAPGLSANRKSSPHSLWVDDVRWNHKYTVGQNRYEDYWVHLKVTDSANRVAYWSGFLTYNSTWFTSTPFPYLFTESVGYSASPSGMLLKEVNREFDAGFEEVGYSTSVVGFSITSAEPPEITEHLSYVAGVVGFNIRDFPLVGTVFDVSGYSAAPSGFLIRTWPNNSPVENLSYSASITGFSIT